MADRDASVHHRYTGFLAQRAGSMILRWTISGGVLGLLVGAVTLTGWANWPVSHGQGYLVALLGAVCGAFFGRAIGSGRAQMLLFQAQLAQHQLDFERRLLGAAAGAGVMVQPQPQPQPQVLPQPEAHQPLPPAPVEAETRPAPEAPVALAPEPVYLPEQPLAFGNEFELPALPDLPTLPTPTLPEPQPAFEPESAFEPQPAAFEPQPVSFEPEPQPPVAPAPVPEPAFEPLPAAHDPAPVHVPLPEPLVAQPFVAQPFVAEPFVPEPAAFAVEPEPSFEPAPQPEAADVLPFVPRSEPVLEPTALPVPPFAASGIPPVSDDASAPTVPGGPADAPASAGEGDPDGYGWWRPGVSEQ